MGDLSAADRKALPKKDFANKPKAKSAKGKATPGSYPIPDANHARLALAMVAKHGDAATKKRVRAAVAKKFPNIGQSAPKKKA